MIDNNPETLFEAWHLYSKDKDKTESDRVPVTLIMPTWVKLSYEDVDKSAADEFGYSSWRSLSALVATGHRFGVNEMWNKYADRMDGIRDIRHEARLSTDRSNPYICESVMKPSYSFHEQIRWNVRLYLKPYGRAIEMGRILNIPASVVNAFACVDSLILNGRDDCSDIRDGAMQLFNEFDGIIDRCETDIKSRVHKD